MTRRRSTLRILRGNVERDGMDADRLKARLAELCGDGVPGASVALTDGTSVVEAVHGVTTPIDPTW